MKYTLGHDELAAWRGDCLAVGFFRDELAQTGPLASLDAALGGLLGSLLGGTGFQGLAEQAFDAYAGPGAPVRRLVVVGLGERTGLDRDRVRRVGAAIARTVKRGSSRTLGIYLPTWDLDRDVMVKALIEGFDLSVYEGLWTILGQRFKSEQASANDELPLQHVTILGASAHDQSAIQAAHVCRGIHLSRELVAAPANVIDPVALAHTAREMAADFGLEVDVAGADACRERRMGAFLAVAGSPSASGHLIHLVYRPPGTPSRRVAIVGEGLTFDEAGLTKPIAGGVQAMKYNKGGAASALGAASVVCQMRPDIEAHFIIPAAQMSSHEKSLSPGDLVTASNGKTIEVNARGAEGCLLLADALALADSLGVDAIVCLATLTDSAIVALGEHVAGLWATDDALADEVMRAAQRAGEPMWRMPLIDRYRDKLWAPFADIRSTGPVEGRAITTALLLREFVASTPWVHIDMTGPVWSAKVDGYYNAGATGFGAATLIHWLCPY
jgi:leucyl aminopeptidase